MGLLLGGVPGVAPGKVTVLGGGVVGANAALIAAGMGARVVVIDRSLDVLRRLARFLDRSVITVFSTAEAVEQHVISADLVVGAVLIPGAAAPRLVSAATVKRMKPGAVVVDVAIDQGGCFETSRPTTHAEPTYIVDGVVHYCVSNMPGAVARTSTYALNAATLPFVLELAGRGWREALRRDPHLRAGLNICEGKVTHPSVAHALGLPCADAFPVPE
jgi:alanine dehydrogenase